MDRDLVGTCYAVVDVSDEVDFHSEGIEYSDEDFKEIFYQGVEEESSQ